MPVQRGWIAAWRVINTSLFMIGWLAPWRVFPTWDSRYTEPMAWISYPGYYVVGIALLRLFPPSLVAWGFLALSFYFVVNLRLLIKFQGEHFNKWSLFLPYGALFGFSL
jgi:hypothetical protein